MLSSLIGLKAHGWVSHLQTDVRLRRTLVTVCDSGFTQEFCELGLNVHPGPQPGARITPNISFNGRGREGEGRRDGRE